MSLRAAVGMAVPVRSLRDAVAQESWSVRGARDVASGDHPSRKRAGGTAASRRAAAGVAVLIRLIVDGLARSTSRAAGGAARNVAGG